MSAGLQALALGAAYGMTILLAVGCLAVLFSRAPIDRHRFATLAFGTCLALPLLLALPMPRPAQGWMSANVQSANIQAGKGAPVETVLPGRGQSDLEFAGPVDFVGPTVEPLVLPEHEVFEAPALEVGLPREVVSVESAPAWGRWFALGSGFFLLRLLFGRIVLWRILRGGQAPGAKGCADLARHCREAGAVDGCECPGVATVLFWIGQRGGGPTGGFGAARNARSYGGGAAARVGAP